MANGQWRHTKTRMYVTYSANKGPNDMRKRLEALAGAADADLERALRAHAEDVIADSQENHVPVMDNMLRASAYVTSGRDASAGKRRGSVWAKMGFSAPHARAVHENPRAGKTGGVSPTGQRYKKWAKVGHWKYLERPLHASERRFLSTVASVVRAAWSRRLAGGA